MAIQIINRSMTNRAYQTNNQTMPMTKTNNANSSPVADSNITYSLYGKNSSGGTVAFAGLQKISSKLPEEVEKIIREELLNIAYGRGTSDRFTEAVRNAANEICELKSPQEGLDIFSQLVKAKNYRGLPVFRCEGYPIWEIGNNLPTVIDFVKIFAQSKSPQKAVNAFNELESFIFAQSERELKPAALDIANSGTPEIIPEFVKFMQDLRHDYYGSNSRYARYKSMTPLPSYCYVRLGNILSQSKSPNDALCAFKKLAMEDPERCVWDMKFEPLYNDCSLIAQSESPIKSVDEYLYSEHPEKKLYSDSDWRSWVEHYRFPSLPR